MPSVDCGIVPRSQPKAPTHVMEKLGGLQSAIHELKCEEQMSDFQKIDQKLQVNIQDCKLQIYQSKFKFLIFLFKQDVLKISEFQTFTTPDTFIQDLLWVLSRSRAPKNLTSNILQLFIRLCSQVPDVRRIFQYEDFSTLRILTNLFKDHESKVLEFLRLIVHGIRITRHESWVEKLTLHLIR